MIRLMRLKLTLATVWAFLLMGGVASAWCFPKAVNSSTKLPSKVCENGEVWDTKELECVPDETIVPDVELTHERVIVVPNPEPTPVPAPEPEPIVEPTPVPEPTPEPVVEDFTDVQGK